MPRNPNERPVKPHTLDRRNERALQQPAPKPLKPHQLDKQDKRWGVSGCDDSCSGATTAFPAMC
jgi:hypothetical protein